MGHSRGLSGHSLAEAGAGLLARPLSGWRHLSGGDLSDVIRADLTDGARVIVKSGPAPRTEAAMLRAIRDSGAPAPAVLAVSDDVLVMEYLPESGGLAPQGWRDLGQALRLMHSDTGAAYGWSEDYAFADVRILNSPCPDWPGFWAERRLLPDVVRLPSPFGHRIARLAETLRDRLPLNPPCGLLHGDMWGGNLVARGGRLAGLIDPACYRGHGEVDLAMLTLFGRPGPGFEEGYGGYDPGMVERRPIYQLWPAIVHVRLFGAGYHGLLDRLLSQCGV